MKIHLSADYQSEIWFYPVCDVNGRLTAVELVTQFVHESAPITLPQDLLLPQLDESQQLRLLQSQIGLLEQHRGFFEAHTVSAFIRIDEGMARTLLASELVMRKIKQLPFILLNITETFPQLKLGKNNPLLASLHAEFNLAISHFGAGKTPLMQSTIIYSAASAWTKSLFIRWQSALRSCRLFRALSIISAPIVTGSLFVALMTTCCWIKSAS